MRVTASKVGLLAYCQAFARPEYEWDTRSSESAERGTRFHKAIATWILAEPPANGGLHPYPLEDDIQEEYERAVEWVQSLGVDPEVLQVEIALAWDPATDTAERLPSKGDRDYSAGKGRLCGTADLVLVTVVDGKPIAATVWDWKTGDGSGAGPQLRALGLMVARALGVEQVTVAALEARKSGVTEVAREELDGFALAMVAGELADQLASIAAAQPVPGAHCGELYCPARLSCPLGKEATVQVIPADALVPAKRFSLADPITTPEHAAWAVDVIRLVNARLEAIKDDIKARVPADGWRLEDGRVLREGHCETPAFDKHKALALIKQLGATPEQIASLHYTFEKSTGLRVTGGAAKPRTKRGKAA